MIVGVDPALTKGAVIVLDEKEQEIKFRNSFVFSSKEPQSIRLYRLFALVEEAISKTNANHVVVEHQFVDVLSRVCGAVEAAGGAHSLNVERLTPSHWRKVLMGKGNVTKEETLLFLEKNYNHLVKQLDKPTDHEIDALAMILCSIKKREQQ